MGFMVTNRTINEPKIAATLPRKITFKAGDDQPLHSLFFCDFDPVTGEVWEIGSEVFFNTFKNLPFEHLLFYIHGFNTTPVAAMNNGKKLQTLFDAKMLNKVGVLPIIWACESSQVNLAEKYLDDQVKGDASGIAFARFFMMFLEWREKNSTLVAPCVMRLSILAHSMGNRVLRSTINELTKSYGYTEIPKVFKHIFMVAADLTNQTLEKGEDGEKLPYICDHLCVYSAMDDLALRSSKVMNTASVPRPVGRRLGHTGTENLSECPKNVYDFNCSDFNTACDPPLGHTYFMYVNNNTANVSACFTHIQETIANRRPKTKTDSNGQPVRTNVIPVV